MELILRKKVFANQIFNSHQINYRMLFIHVSPYTCMRAHIYTCICIDVCTHTCVWGNMNDKQPTVLRQKAFFNHSLYSNCKGIYDSIVLQQNPSILSNFPFWRCKT